MFVGYNFFGKTPVFDSQAFHPSYEKADFRGGILDEIYVDENANFPATHERPTEWEYSTVIHADFNGSLEAGSVEARGRQISKLRFQKRKTDELLWEDFVEIDYDAIDRKVYEVVDKYVANGFEYQYSLFPVAVDVTGDRILSEEIQIKFEGMFLTDRESNYHLFYDLNISEIENHLTTQIFEPMGSKYPIVAYSGQDYAIFNVSATFLSTETIKNRGNIQVQFENKERTKLLNFLKNGKPKIYRDHMGNLMIVAVNGPPKETPNNNISGLSTISFGLTEIGEVEFDTLTSFDLLRLEDRSI